GEPDELEKAFIDFVLSEEGQKVVEDMGYIKLTGETGEIAHAPTPEATQMSTATPTPTAATPGFVMISAVVGLLAVSYAVHSRRR
ncbi:MAG: hypothetical protein J7J01_10535, partial [Methanophagales archaeon]|nr:hypothetical protein [Methanophagales archaeon]